MGLKSLKTKVENFILNTPLLPKKYSHLLLLLSLAFFSTECAQKKAGALGGSSGGTATTSGTSTSVDQAIDTAISYTQSTIAVASSVDNGDSVTVYATFKNAAGEKLDRPNEVMSFSLTGGGTSNGTFSTPQYDSVNKAWYSVFTATHDGTASQVVVTHQLNGNPQALTSTLPSITVNALSAPTVTLSMSSARVGSNPFVIDINFSRAVVDFDALANALTVSYAGAGGSITSPSSVSGSQTHYQVTVTPADSADVTLSIDAGKAHDALGYANAVSASYVAKLYSLFFNNPSDGAYFTSNIINGDGVCNFASGATITLTVNGSNNPVNAPVCNSGDTWSSVPLTNYVSLTEGANTLVISQTNPDGTTSSETRTVYLDTTAPTIVIDQASTSITTANLSAVTYTSMGSSPHCGDNLGIASFTATLVDAGNVTYGPINLTCSGGHYTAVFDASAATTPGYMTMYATITDNAGNQSTASAIIGQYYVSGYISNLREANSETCIGDYCNGGANGYLDMLGDCKSAANSTVRLRLTDSNGSELRNINDVSCSSDAFSNNINVNDQLNGVGDGSYRVRAIQCNDNTSECSQQDYNITVDQADTCYVSGSHSDAYPSAGGCGTVNTYDDYTCEHTPPYSVGTGSNYVCNCVGSWNSTSYSNFNNNAGAKYCTVIRTDTSYSYYDNGGFSCGTNYTDSNYSEGFYCGQTLGGYECGGDSSVLNGCWRCTDNTSQNPTDCANNTIVTPSGRTWTAASCSHTDGMAGIESDEDFDEIPEREEETSKSDSVEEEK
jgi:hypothetical protein